MSDTAWIVTNGEYSNYSVVAAFTTEAAAEAYCAWLIGPGEIDRYDHRVKQLPLNPTPQPEASGYYCTRWAYDGRWLVRYTHDLACASSDGYAVGRTPAECEANAVAKWGALIPLPFTPYRFEP